MFSSLRSLLSDLKTVLLNNVDAAMFAYVVSLFYNRTSKLAVHAAVHEGVTQFAEWRWMT